MNIDDIINTHHSFMEEMGKITKDHAGSIKVIIIDVPFEIPHQFIQPAQFLNVLKASAMSRFGWVDYNAKAKRCTFLCKGITETYEPVNKQGKDFIRYTAIRR